MPSPFTPEVPARAGERRYWVELEGAAQALAIAQSARQHKSLTLVVTRDTATA